ncbi:MAG: phosphoribosylanthranilate isomerase [Prevotellaceae bacterium]|nr:phosphoribosylanthranilate isomerase [Prevotellaceae bacterium]
MIIKVSGMREARNIREVSALGIDMIGFDFYPSSERFVQMVSSQAGIIPDYSRERFRKVSKLGEKPAELIPAEVYRTGVFIDDMPQTIISRVYNYSLNYVQLNGEESEVMIDNLKRSLVPDIVPDIKVIKSLDIHSAADFAQCKHYEGSADLFIFNVDGVSKILEKNNGGIALIEAYTGNIPFLLGGNVVPDDAKAVGLLRHPQFAGVDLNEQFEVSVGVKDVERLQKFIASVKQ